MKPKAFRPRYLKKSEREIVEINDKESIEVFVDSKLLGKIIADAVARNHRYQRRLRGVL